MKICGRQLSKLGCLALSVCAAAVGLVLWQVGGYVDSYLASQRVIGGARYVIEGDVVDEQGNAYTGKWDLWIEARRITNYGFGSADTHETDHFQNGHFRCDVKNATSVELDFVGLGEAIEGASMQFEKGGTYTGLRVKMIREKGASSQPS